MLASFPDLFRESGNEYSSPRFCIRVIAGIEISVGEENKKERKGNKRRKTRGE